MNKLLFLAVAVLAAGMPSLHADEPSGFAKKVELTLSNAAKTAIGEGSFANVPVLVKLSTAISGFAYSDFQRSRGSDMIFVDEQGNVIPHEIDTWDPTGESLVWLKPATLSSALGKITMYYGNADIPASSASDVWRNYTGVWHFDDATKLSTSQSEQWPTAQAAYANSTAVDGLEGFLHTASIPDEVGCFGKCFRVNTAGCKTGNYNDGGVWVNDAGENSPLDCNGIFTISGWFKHPTEEYYYDHLFYKRSASDNSAKSGTKQFVNGFAIELSASSVATPKFDVRGSGSTSTSGGAIDAYDKWSYLTFVFDGTNLDVYENGVNEYSSTGLSIVKDNNAPLAFGARPDVAYSGFTGDAHWCGWIDEVRFSSSAATADYVSVEYKAMTQDFFDFGEAQSLAEDLPVLGVPELQWDGDKWNFSAEMSGGRGTIYSVITDVATGMAVTNAVSGGVVEGIGAFGFSPDLASGGVYTFFVLGVTASDIAVKVYGEYQVSADAVTVTKTKDAEEAGRVPGRFVFSRATGGPEFTLQYEVSGTAVAGESYAEISGAVTFGDGVTEVVVSVDPYINPTVNENTTVIVAPASRAQLAVASATMTIVNDTAASGAVTRFVSVTGNDENDGLTMAHPLRSVAVACAAVDAALTDDGKGCVYVGAGNYAETSSVSGSNDKSCVVVTKAISVIGLTGDADDVVITRGTQSCRLFEINHADAKLQFLTLRGGYLDSATDSAGGCAMIGSNGGTIADCVLENGTAHKWGGGGGNLYMIDGRVVRTVIRNGTVLESSLRAGRIGGGGVAMKGGIIENCLITGNTKGYAAGVMVYGGKVLNCTVTGNSEAQCGGIMVKAGTSSEVRNTIIYGNVGTSTEEPDNCNVYIISSGDSSVGWSGTDSVFFNCYGEVAINANCTAANPYFAAPEIGDYRLGALSSCRDVVTDYSTTGAISDTDLDGESRQRGAAVDAGCYEMDQSVFAVDFDFIPRGLFTPAVVDCRAVTIGGEGTIVYKWDLDGDGVAERETTDSAFVLNDFPAGIWTVGVKATDGSAREVSAVKTISVKTAPRNMYVKDSNPDAQFPYDTWETAASGLAGMRAAVAAGIDGSTVWVGDGVYAHGINDGVGVTISEGVRLIGYSGDPSSVVITNTLGLANANAGRSDLRDVCLNHPNAFVANMTLAKGSIYHNGNKGGNVTIDTLGGTVSNCVLTAGSAANYYGDCGGAFLSAGLLTHCIIEKSTIQSKGAGNKGAAIFSKSGSRVSNCLIRDVVNEVAVEANIVRVAGQIENCTVVNCNVGTNNHEAVRCDSTADARNVVAFGNTAPSGVDEATVVRGFGGTATCFINCASDDDSPVDGTDCITITAAAFKDYVNGDFTPASGGALRNAGVTIANAPKKDLAGKKRIRNSNIDIGCYEYQPPVGLKLFVK